METLLQDFDINRYKKSSPPKDNSLVTLKEIKELSNLYTDPKFVKDKDNVKKSFKNITKKYGLPFPKEIYKQVISESAPKILELKKHFNRPRPKYLSKNFGLDLKDVELDSMKTPSYPSGHSAQGVLLGEVLSKIYPRHSEEFRKEGKDISLSRRVGKAHFKSDSDLGEKIGMDMYQHIKNKINV